MPYSHGAMYKGESVPATAADFTARVSTLIDHWCERRALGPLREILQAWPQHMGLTDEWGELYGRLHRIAGLGHDLPPAERDEVADLATFAWRAVHRR